MKLLEKNNLDLFFKQIVEKSKEINAYPIESKEFDFIFDNFSNHLKKQNKRELKILEIGGGIGSFMFRFVYKLIKNNFFVDYYFIEKKKENIVLFEDYLNRFKNLVEKKEKEKLKLFKINIMQGDAIEILEDLANSRKIFDFVLIDANKKKYKEYLLISLKISDFIVIDDIFFKAKNKKTKSIENYLKNFLSHLEKIKEFHNLELKYLKEGFGLVIIKKKD